MDHTAYETYLQWQLCLCHCCLLLLASYSKNCWQIYLLRSVPFISISVFIPFYLLWPVMLVSCLDLSSILLHHVLFPRQRLESSQFTLASHISSFPVAQVINVFLRSRIEEG